MCLGIEMEVWIRSGTLKDRARSKDSYFDDVEADLRDLGVRRWRRVAED